MAGTLSGDYSVVGNKRVYSGLLTVASTSISAFIDVPGIRYIKAAVATPVSGATKVFSLHYNLDTDSAEANGVLGITSCLASNIYSVLVFGE
jgi:hypothetical protein